MSRIFLVRTTVADATTAERLGRQMVEEKLAACATFAAARSVYRWHGAIETDDETEILFKTTLDRAAALRARIAALHAYDLPVIEAWEAQVDPAVADWVYGATGA
jgi:periplasmic divalent cation tolerance protein